MVESNVNSQSEWQCCAGHLTVTFFSMPLVRETTTRIGFCAPFFDSHVSLRYSHIRVHMRHFQTRGIQFPLDCASDAIQISEIQRDHQRGTDILYITVV